MPAVYSEWEFLPTSAANSATGPLSGRSCPAHSPRHHILDRDEHSRSLSSLPAVHSYHGRQLLPPGMPWAGVQDFADTIKSFQSLWKLDLCISWLPLSEHFLECVLPHLLQLQELQLRGSPPLTPPSLLCIVKHLPRLHRLALQMNLSQARLGVDYLLFLHSEMLRPSGCKFLDLSLEPDSIEQEIVPFISMFIYRLFSALGSFHPRVEGMQFWYWSFAEIRVQEFGALGGEHA